MIMSTNGSATGGKGPLLQRWWRLEEAGSPRTPEGLPGSFGSPGWNQIIQPGRPNDLISERNQATTAATTQNLTRIVEEWSKLVARWEKVSAHSAVLRTEAPYQYGRFALAGKGPSDQQERQDAVSLPRGRLTGPVRFVQKLLQDWHLDERAACLILGFEESETSYVEDLLAGRVSLRGRDVKHRIAFLLQIRETLDRLFRDLEVENEWLRESKELLDNHAPIDLLLEGSFISLLKLKEFVDVVAGR
jgi:hypothetical protein